MATYKYQLAGPPASERARDVWLQHAAGFILFEDMRRYATERVDPNLAPELRESVEKGIDDAVYGLMMIIDGVTGALSNDSERVQLRVVAQHVRNEDEREGVVINEVDLGDGDGMCIGFHSWREGDFGSDPVATPTRRS